MKIVNWLHGANAVVDENSQFDDNQKNDNYQKLKIYEVYSLTSNISPLSLHYIFKILKQ